MNWKYLGPRLALAGLLWAFFALAFDPLIRRGAIFVCETGSGSRMEIQGLKTSFAAPGVVLENVRIGDRSKPMSNLMEFSESRVQLALGPLLRGRYVVQDATISGLKWNTPRPDAGAVPDWKPAWKRWTADSLDGWKFELPGNLNDKAGELGRSAFEEFVNRARTTADPNQLDSYRLVRELETAWPEKFEALANRARTLEDEINRIRKDITDPTATAPARIEAAVRSYERLQQLLAEAQQLRMDLQSLPMQAREDFDRLNEAKNRDLENLQKKIEIVRMDGDSLSSLLLGDELKQKLSEFAGIVGRIRDGFRDTPAEMPPLRTRGRTIEFPDRNPAPRYHLARMQFAGQASIGNDPLDFTATLCDLSSDPRRLGRPTTFHLMGRGATTLEITGTFNRAADIPEDELVVTWLQPRPAPLVLGKPDSLQIQVAPEQVEWQSRWYRRLERIEGTITMRQSAVRLLATLGPPSDAASTSTEQVRTASAESRRLSAGIALPAVSTLNQIVPDTADDARNSARNLVSRALANTLDSIHELEATVSIVVEPDAAPEIHLKSNLGPMLASGLKSDLVASLNEQREAVLARIEDDLTAQTVELRDMMGRRYKDVLKSIDLREADAQSLVEQVAAKNINVEALRPIQNLTESKTAESLKKVAQGELPAKPRDLDGVRKDVRDIRNDIKSLRDVRNVLRK